MRVHACESCLGLAHLGSRHNKRADDLHTSSEFLPQCSWLDRPQAGTSHELGDNFAKAFGTRFLNEVGELVHVQQTSWGASTRLIGGIIMTHGARLASPCTGSMAGAVQACRPFLLRNCLPAKAARLAARCRVH